MDEVQINIFMQATQKIVMVKILMKKGAKQSLVEVKSNISNL